MNRDGREQIPVVLTVAGTDPSGGAGINVDLQVFRDFGVHGVAAIAAVVWQNTQGVRGWQPMEPSQLRAQLEAVADDFELAAVKIGMVPTAELIDEVARFLKQLDESVSVVLDPVMASGAGDRALTTAGARQAFGELAGCVDLITPNIPEAKVLGGDSGGEDDPQKLIRQLLDAGWERVLLTGGHLNRDAAQQVVDWYGDGDRIEPLEGLEPVDADVRGTGCQLSSAIAAGRATGAGWRGSVDSAREYLHRLLVHNARRLGRGRPLVVRTLDGPDGEKR